MHHFVLPRSINFVLALMGEMTNSQSKDKTNSNTESVNAGGQQGASLGEKGFMGCSHYLTNDLTNKCK